MHLIKLLKVDTFKLLHLFCYCMTLLNIAGLQMHLTVPFIETFLVYLIVFLGRAAVTKYLLKILARRYIVLLFEV